MNLIPQPNPGENHAPPSLLENSNSAAGSKFFGAALPHVKEEELTGKLIVIEGPDGSGRSTQIALLTEWLEREGFPVQTMGLRRSNLLAKNIDEILAKNLVTRLTHTLMYATDFFDQLQNKIIPALRAGNVVLADRYVFTLIARASVRGVNKQYLNGIYQMTLRPDLTFWLNVQPKVTFEREFRKSQVISYWESGRDMFFGSGLYKSFIRYQTRMRKEFRSLAKTYSFISINGEQSIAQINQELRKPIAQLLEIKNVHFSPSRPSPLTRSQNEIRSH